jgi:hypothetical protein
MNRFLIIFIAFLLLFFRNISIVRAQPVLGRFEVAYQKYQESVSTYRETYDEYVLARSQYIRFGTLQAEKEARDKTIAFLEARDQVVMDYLALPRIKLEEEIGIDETIKTDLLARIDDELVWYESHQDALSSALTLDELVSDSNEAQTRYKKTQEVAFSSVAEISFGKVVSFSDRFDEIFEFTKDKLNSIKSDTREEYQLSERQNELVDRWVLETETRKNRAEELSLDVRDKVTKKGFAGEINRSLSVYNEMLGGLSVVVNHLDEGGRFIQEILRIIKTKD